MHRYLVAVGHQRLHGDELIARGPTYGVVAPQRRLGRTGRAVAALAAAIQSA